MMQDNDMASDDDELPQKLDLRTLQVHEQLGEPAGSASYWRADWSGQEITLKVLNPRPKSSPAKPGAVNIGSSTPSPDEDLRDMMFLREAQISIQLEHRHIVRCLGAAQLPGGYVPNQPAPALAMALERCEPQAIKDLITRGMAAGRRVYKASEAFRWLVQVSSALSYLHARKPAIVHRDVRADSILLKRAASGDMACKLSNFGLHAVLYDDRSNALRRRAFTQTIMNPLADSSTAGGRGGGGNCGGDECASQSASSASEMTASRAGGVAKTMTTTTTTPAANGAAQSAGPAGRPSSDTGATCKTSAADKVVRGGQAGEPGSLPALSAGLGTVESLIRQLGMSDLKPLQPQEMERVYCLPEKAESFIYMAPEVYNNLPCNERSDVFSFGVLAYELLTGELLSISIFNTVRAAKMGIKDPQGYAAKVADGYRPARTQAVSDAAWALLCSCWHQDPVQRPTMAQVEAQLQKLATELDGVGSPLAGSPKGVKAPPVASAAKPVRQPVDGPSPGCAQQCVIC